MRNGKTVSHPIWLHRYRFESCPDRKKKLKKHFDISEKSITFVVSFNDLKKQKKWKVLSK
jgi:hypothetical protein